MRIAFLLHSMLRSGGNLATLLLADRMMRRGHEVEIVVQERFFPIVLDHVGFERVPPARFLDEPAALSGFDWALTNWWECAYRLEGLGARAFGLLRHGDEERLYDPVGRHFDLAIAALWREPGLAVFAVAPHLLEEPRREGRAVILVPNGVDHALFGAARPSLPPKLAPLRVLVEGPLDAPHKRTRETLALLGSIDGLEIVHVAADGSALGESVAAHTFGPLAHSELAGVMASCDLLVKLSSLEAAPMPVQEMAAAGKPTIVSAFPGAGFSVLDGETGLVVPLTGGDGAARAAIERCRDDRALRERLGAAARGRSLGFTWERSAEALEAGLIDLLPGSPPRLAHLARFRPSYEATLHLWVRDETRKMQDLG
jgi:hypothetical protein